MPAILINKLRISKDYIKLEVKDIDLYLAIELNKTLN